MVFVGEKNVKNPMDLLVFLVKRFQRFGPKSVAGRPVEVELLRKVSSGSSFIVQYLGSFLDGELFESWYRMSSKRNGQIDTNRYK